MMVKTKYIDIDPCNMRGPFTFAIYFIKRYLFVSSLISATSILSDFKGNVWPSYISEDKNVNISTGFFFCAKLTKTVAKIYKSIHIRIYTLFYMKIMHTRTIKSF